MARPRPRRISDFKPTLTNLAQTSHYEVRFGRAPAGLANYLKGRGVDGRFITGDMGLLCFSAQIPFANIATANITGAFTGIGEKFAHSRIFTPITLTFYVDKEYRVLKFLEHWMEFTAGGTHAPGGRTGVIKQNRSNYFIRMQYPEEYRINLIQQDKLNSIVDELKSTKVTGNLSNYIKDIGANHMSLPSKKVVKKFWKSVSNMKQYRDVDLNKAIPEMYDFYLKD